MVVEADEARAEVDRLLHSRVFDSSEVHRRLLRYLTEKTLSGEADRLKEYTVGLDAFGKPPTYDPRHDSIVRLQMGRLRQKLMAYYQTEGADDPICIGLPKGGFKLTFDPRAPAVAKARLGYSSRVLAVVVAVAVIWACIASAGWWTAHKRGAIADSRWNADLEELWQPFLQTERSLVVCVGTPLFVRVPGYGFFRDPRSNSWEDVERSERFAQMKRALEAPELMPSYAFTGAGEASAAFLISKLLSTRKRELLLTRSSLLSWQQIADHDVIFIGPPKFNLQLQVAALAQDLVVEADGIRNLKPRPGEPEFLADRIVMGRNQDGETHALVSRIPGLAGTGELLVIAGNASPDTMAAAEWLTQPARASALARHLRGAGRGIPRYFQAVIKVAFKQGIPVQSSYVFHHELPDAARQDSRR